MSIAFGNVEVRDPTKNPVAMAYRRFQAVLSSLAVVSNGVETPILLIKNPAGNVNPMLISRRKLAALIAAHSAIFKAYSNPTVTSTGTQITATPNTRVNSSAPSPTGQVFSSPSVSANGTLIDQDISANQAQVSTDDPIVVDPGATVLITANVSNANDTVAAVIGWSEG